MLSAAGTSGTVGPNLDEAQPSAEKAYEQILNGGGGMPAFQDQLTEQQIADVTAYVVESTRLILPDDFPRDVEVIACDLDRTLIAEDLILRERTKRAVAQARAAGIRVDRDGAHVPVGAALRP